MKKEIKEMISYIVVGGCTTLINFVIYWMVLQVINQGWLVANSISWLGAVIFAFVANKRYVFKSDKNAKTEGIQFFGLRLVTLMVENILLYLFIQLIGMNELVAKVVVSVVTVVANYGICKYKIFVGKGEM